jgi:hypothetical protein
VQGENHGFFPKIGDFFMFDGSGGGQEALFAGRWNRGPRASGFCHGLGGDAFFLSNQRLPSNPKLFRLASLLEKEVAADGCMNQVRLSWWKILIYG